MTTFAIIKASAIQMKRDSIDGFDPVFFTIVSANYFAYAITLMSSIREHHPRSRRYVFLADETETPLDFEMDLFELRLARSLPIQNFDHLAFRYSILEFNTAIKPFAIKQLLNEHGNAAITYIDPDILLLSPLVDVMSLLSANALAVLTPHLTAPLDDGKMPDELAILRVGSFNLGFIATGHHPARQALIDWWCSKLEFDAYVDLERGTFTDQKWMDLVPGMFPDVRILRHPGYNLAYWNLGQRRVSLGGDGKLLAGGKEVAFVHFSGVDPRRPENFSKHQNRFDASMIGDLLPVYQSYISSLLGNGYDKYLRIPYRYGFLRDGTSITPEMRAVFSRKFDIGCQNEVSNPFALGAEKFRENVPLSAVAARWGQKIYLRARNVWPVKALVNRLSPNARRALRAFIIDATMMKKGKPDRRPGRTVPLAAADVGVERQSALSANFIGYLYGEFGVAENARLFVAAADAVGVELALTNIDASATARQDDKRVEARVTNDPEHKINIVFANADQTPIVVTGLGDRYQGDRYTIAYWFWELGIFPEEWRSSFEFVDEIWVATDFVRDAVSRMTEKPVKKVRPAVDVILNRPYGRRDFGLPDDKFIFLFSFDFSSFVERKNPYGPIVAFQRAFASSDDRALLIIKSTNGDRNPSEFNRLRAMVADDDRIIFRDEFLQREEMFGLESVVDCYVSLHRAEGFGLGLAESMALGKPVIGTAYSGNMEFMNGANSCLVGYELIDIGKDQYPFGEGKQWAEPDVAQASFHMRRLVDEPAYASSIGAAAAAHMRAEFSLAASGGAMAERLAQIPVSHSVAQA